MMPASRSSTRLVDGRHAEPVGAGRERGPRDRHRAVPVAVGLHDRHEQRPGRRERLERATLCAIAPRSISAQAQRRSVTLSSSRRWRGRCRDLLTMPTSLLAVEHRQPADVALDQQRRDVLDASRRPRP